MHMSTHAHRGFHLLVSSSNGCNSHSYTWIKPAAWNFIQFPLGYRVLSSTVKQDAFSRKLDWDWRVLELKCCYEVGYRNPKWWHNLLCYCNTFSHKGPAIPHDKYKERRPKKKLNSFSKNKILFFWKEKNRNITEAKLLTIFSDAVILYFILMNSFPLKNRDVKFIQIFKCS